MIVLRKKIMFSEPGFRGESEIKRITKDEAVRVKKICREVREPQSVKLRREEIVVDRDTQIETTSRFAG